MKKGWEYKKLNNICFSIEDGDWIESKDQSPNGIRLIQTGNIGNGGYKDKQESAKYISEETFKRLHCTEIFEGDILVSRLPDPVGRACILPYLGCRCITAVDCSILKIKKDLVCDAWITYYMQSQAYFSIIKAQCTGSTRLRITRKKLAEILIPVPSLSEQHSIVDYLDSAFAKIDAMKANAEKALNEAKALFQASLKEMLEPKEGWEEKRIDEVCSIARGGSPRPIKDYITNSPDGLNWIKIGDTDMGGKYIYSTKEKIKPEGLKKSRWVEVDEFLLSNSMSFGRPYILKTNGCIHDGWLVLRDYQQYLNIDFFYYVLSSENVQKQFRTKAQGSTVSNLNTDRVASVTLSVPPFTEQQSIVTTLDSLKSKVDSLQAYYEKISQECDALKQAILRQVFE